MNELSPLEVLTSTTIVSGEISKQVRSTLQEVDLDQGNLKEEQVVDDWLKPDPNLAYESKNGSYFETHSRRDPHALAHDSHEGKASAQATQ